jgi:hypothetical protein
MEEMSSYIYIYTHTHTHTQNTIDSRILSGSEAVVLYFYASLCWRLSFHRGKIKVESCASLRNNAGKCPN